MQITTQLDEPHANKLAYIQQQTNLDVADVLQQAIDLYYQHLQQPSDPLAKLKQGRFIGRFKAAPDFATNSKAILQDLMQQRHDHR